MRNADMFHGRSQTEYERLIQEKRDALELEQTISLLEHTIERDQADLEAHRQVVKELEEGIATNESILRTKQHQLQKYRSQDDYLQKIFEEREKG